MEKKRSPLAVVGVVMLALSVSVGMTVSVAGAEPAQTAAKKKKKKKKKKKSKPVTVTVTKTVGAVIPDAAAAAPNTFGKLSTPLEVTGTQLTKKSVGRVEITFQTTGAIVDAANDLNFHLVSPQGRRVTLGPNSGTLGGQSIGPLTLTPNSPVGTCNVPMPPCADPDQTLGRPFAGTAGDVGLVLFNGLDMAGTWTFVVTDDTNLKTSTLDSVTLVVASAKPVT